MVAKSLIRLLHLKEPRQRKLVMAESQPANGDLQLADEFAERFTELFWRKYEYYSSVSGGDTSGKDGKKGQLLQTVLSCLLDIVGFTTAEAKLAVPIIKCIANMVTRVSSQEDHMKRCIKAIQSLSGVAGTSSPEKFEECLKKDLIDGAFRIFDSFSTDESVVEERYLEKKMFFNLICIEAVDRVFDYLQKIKDRSELPKSVAEVCLYGLTQGDSKSTLQKLMLTGQRYSSFYKSKIDNMSNVQSLAPPRDSISEDVDRVYERLESKQPLTLGALREELGKFTDAFANSLRKNRNAEVEEVERLVDLMKQLRELFENCLDQVRLIQTKGNNCKFEYQNMLHSKYS